MSLATNLQNAFTRVATELRSLRLLATGSSTGDLSGLNTTTKTSLVAAINEVSGRATGGSTNLDGLADVAVSGPATGQILRYDGTNFVNVDPAPYYQPRDADLDALAALTTTPYGRSLLEKADAAAVTAMLNAATATVMGIVQLATDAKAIAGTDSGTVITPANLAAAFGDRIDNGALGTSTTKAPSQAAVKAYADALIGANDAMVFKGVIDASTTVPLPPGNRGDTYKISVAGRLGSGGSGVNVEVGDLLIVVNDGATGGSSWASKQNDYAIVQANIDGAVTGPATSITGNLASFSGTTGKVIADSGYGVDNDAALTAGSATRVPTQAAVKTYAQPKDAELTALAGLVSAADQVPYFTGAGTAALMTVTAAARTLLDDADIPAMRATFSVYSQAEIGDPNTDFVAGFVTALNA